MRILMLGNSLTSAQDMPDILAELTGAEVVCHTRGGARLSEHLNPNTRLGARTQAALAKEQWDYVVLQEMSHGPITAPGELFRQRGAALPADPGERGHPGALCHLGLSEGWGPAVGQGMGLWRDGPEPVRGVPQGGGGKPRPACRRGAAVLPAARHAGTSTPPMASTPAGRGPHCGGNHSGGDSTTQGGPIMIRDICKDQAFLAQKPSPPLRRTCRSRRICWRHWKSTGTAA